LDKDLERLDHDRSANAAIYSLVGNAAKSDLVVVWSVCAAVCTRVGGKTEQKGEGRTSTWNGCIPTMFATDRRQCNDILAGQWWSSLACRRTAGCQEVTVDVFDNDSRPGLQFSF